MQRMSAIYLGLAVVASAVRRLHCTSALSDGRLGRPAALFGLLWQLSGRSRRTIRRTMPPCPWSARMAKRAGCSSRKLALYRTRQSLRCWGRICRRAVPTHTIFSAWPSASLTWFTAARLALLPRLRRHEQRRNTFMAPRAPLGGGLPRADRAPRRTAPGPQSETEKPPATR